MVARVARHRQPPALHGVGEHHRRTVFHSVTLVVGVEHRRHAVAAEVGDQFSELRVVGHLGHQVPHRQRRTVEELRPELVAGEPEQRLIVLVGHRVDPRPQRRPARTRERRIELGAVLHLDDVPPGRLELTAPLLDPYAGDDPVQGLAVEVDHPHGLAESLRRRVEHRLPDVALVELGVPDEGDEAARVAGTEVRVDVTAHRGGEQRRRHAQSDRPGGEVDLVGILCPARVRLQSASGAQRRQVGTVEVAEQVLDRVEHRGGVRLDGDAVGGVQVGEPQRGHGGHHRGAGRLVATDLDPIRVVPVVVGGVHDPGREPQHALLDLLERGHLVRRQGLRHVESLRPRGQRVSDGVARPTPAACRSGAGARRSSRPPPAARRRCGAARRG